MSRPKYKELYEKERQRADYWAEQHKEVAEKLDESRKLGVKAAQDRASMRYSLVTLHQRSTEFLLRLRLDLLSTSVEKDGWLIIPQLHPETAQALLYHFSKFNNYVDTNRPPIL